MKRKGIRNPVMHWLFINPVEPYKNGSKRSLTEKYHILASPINLINQRSELVSECSDENKFYLVNYKTIPPDR